jgi:hypothetical protein
MTPGMGTVRHHGLAEPAAGLIGTLLLPVRKSSLPTPDAQMPRNSDSSEETGFYGG